jgi:hypothetical protein
MGLKSHGRSAHVKKVEESPAVSLGMLAIT